MAVELLERRPRVELTAPKKAKSKSISLRAVPKPKSKIKKERKSYDTADKFVSRIADTVAPEPQYVLRLFQRMARRKEKGKPRSKRMITEIVKLNQRFVARIARRYMNQGLCYEDLFQEGNIGLLRAIDKFDWTRGYQFSTCAEWWVREGITRAIKNKSRLIRIPIQRLQMKVKVQKEWNDTYTNQHTTASSAELAEKTGFTVAQVEEFATYNHDPKSLESSVSTSRDTPLSELLADKSALPDENIEREQDNQELYGALNQLSSVDAAFIKRYYGLSGSPPRSDEQMSELYMMSKSSVRKKVKLIQEQLREIMSASRLNLFAEKYAD